MWTKKSIQFEFNAMVKNSTEFTTLDVHIPHNSESNLIDDKNL